MFLKFHLNEKPFLIFNASRAVDGNYLGGNTENGEEGRIDLQKGRLLRRGDEACPKSDVLRYKRQINFPKKLKILFLIMFFNFLVYLRFPNSCKKEKLQNHQNV